MSNIEGRIKVVFGKILFVKILVNIMLTNYGI